MTEPISEVRLQEAERPLGDARSQGIVGLLEAVQSLEFSPPTIARKKIMEKLEGADQVNRYHTFAEALTAHITPTDLKVYDLGYCKQKNSYETFTPLICIHKDNHKSIKGFFPYVPESKDGKTFVVLLDRTFDMYHHFRFGLYPHQILKSAKLCFEQKIPKEEYTELPYDWDMNEKYFTQNYLPILSLNQFQLDRHTGEFDFSLFLKCPIYSNKLAIVMEVESMKSCEENRTLWVEGFMMQEPIRRKTFRIEEKYFNGNNQVQIEESAEQEGLRRDREALQEKIRFCPVCNESAQTVCNCDKQDSTCKNGHHWYVHHGKIVLGEYDHTPVGFTKN